MVRKNFNDIVNRLSWSEEKWEFILSEGKYKGIAHPKYNSMMNESHKVKNMGFEKFLEIKLEEANSHYLNSVYKLARRVFDNEFNFSNIQVVKSKVEENLTITITDGVKTLNAYTIIASGPIQCPHYRCLIK